MSLYIDLLSDAGEHVIKAVRAAHERSATSAASVLQLLMLSALSASESAIALEMYFDFAEQLLEAHRSYLERVRGLVQTCPPEELVADFDHQQDVEPTLPALVVLNDDFASATN